MNRQPTNQRSPLRPTELWLAVLAGPGSWSDEEASPIARALGVAIGLALWPLGILLRGRGPTARTSRGAIGLAVARGLLSAAVAITCFTTVSSQDLFVIWPLGLAIGVENALAARAIGISSHPLDWWRRVMTGPAHVGFVIALGASLLVTDASQRRTLVLAYLCLHIIVGVGVVTLIFVTRVSESYDADQALKQAELTSREHRSRAHWLHDDVCAELRYVRLQLENGGLDADQVASELDALDHRLRVRQLDEVLVGGNATVAEVVQPYLRSAQRLGITLTESPSFDVARITLFEIPGRLLQRSVAGLVANAVAAGAGEIGVRVERHGAMLTLSVADNAGGFEASSIPLGRGLDTLRCDVGIGAMRFERLGAAMVVSVDIALTGNSVFVTPSQHRATERASQ